MAYGDNPYGTRQEWRGGVLYTVTDPSTLPVSSSGSGTIGPSSATAAAQANAAYLQGSTGAYNPLVGANIAGASPASVAAFLNETYNAQNRAGYSGGAGVYPTRLANANVINPVTGEGIGTGTTFVTTPQGVVSLPYAGSADYQAAQNIALFGTAVPGAAVGTGGYVRNQQTGTMEFSPLVITPSAGNVAAANRFLGVSPQQSDQKLQFASDYAYGQAVNALPTRAAQEAFIARNDDPRATLSWLQRYGNEPTVTGADVGKAFQSSAVFSPISTFGDTKSQSRISELIKQGYDPIAATTLALEEQRQGSTGRAQAYYAGEEARAAGLGVQLPASASELMGRGYKPYAGNPFEPSGDTYVELLQGYPQKGAIGPLSGTTPLPTQGGVPTGLQVFGWNKAIAESRGKAAEPLVGTYAPAINLAASRYGQIYSGIGVTGPFGDYERLAGIQYNPGLSFAENGQIRVEPTALSPAGATTVFVPMPGMVAPSGAGAATRVGVMPELAETQKEIGTTGVYTTPIGFVKLGTNVPESQIVKAEQQNLASAALYPLVALAPTGPMGLLGGQDVGAYYRTANLKTGLADYTNYIGQLAQPPTTSTEQYNRNLAEFNTAKGNYESNVGAYKSALSAYQIGGSRDAAQYTALQTNYKDILSQEQMLGEKYKSLQNERVTLETVPQSPIEKIYAGYQGLNKLLAPASSDILGVGKTAETLSYQTSNPYAAKGFGFIGGTLQSPIDIGVGLATGGIYSELKGVAAAGLATRTAPSTYNFLSSLGKVAETGAGIYLLGSGVVAAESQPTPQKQGAAYGELTAGGFGFSVGSSGGAGGKGTTEALGNIYESARGGIFRTQQKVGGVTRLPPESGLSYYTEPASVQADTQKLLKSGQPRYDYSNVPTDAMRYADLERMYGTGSPQLPSTFSTELISPMRLGGTRSTVSTEMINPLETKYSYTDALGRTTEVGFDPLKLEKSGYVVTGSEAFANLPVSGKSAKTTTDITINPYSGTTLVKSEKVTEFFPSAGKSAVERGAMVFNLYNLPPTVITPSEAAAVQTTFPYNAVTDIGVYTKEGKSIAASRIAGEVGRVERGGYSYQISPNPPYAAEGITDVSTTRDITKAFKDIATSGQPEIISPYAYQSANAQQLSKALEIQGQYRKNPVQAASEESKVIESAMRFRSETERANAERFGALGTPDRGGEIGQFLDQTAGKQPFGTMEDATNFRKATEARNENYFKTLNTGAQSATVQESPPLSETFKEALNQIRRDLGYSAPKSSVSSEKVASTPLGTEELTTYQEPGAPPAEVSLPDVTPPSSDVSSPSLTSLTISGAQVSQSPLDLMGIFYQTSPSAFPGFEPDTTGRAIERAKGVTQGNYPYTAIIPERGTTPIYGPSEIQLPYRGTPPIETPRTTPYTPTKPGQPNNPFEPKVPTFPIIPGLPKGFDFGGGGAAGFGRRGKRKFREILPIGLDISTFGRGGGINAAKIYSLPNVKLPSGLSSPSGYEEKRKRAKRGRKK